MIKRTYTIRKLRWKQFNGKEPAFRIWIAAGLMGFSYDIQMTAPRCWTLRTSYHGKEWVKESRWLSEKMARAAAQAHFEATLKHYLKIAK